MRLEPSDPDIETIVTRIERGDLDLQPEFQRGEVWSRSKKQRLIDSIFREWHIPPIHVIEIKGSRKQEVLDGQQRLAAIRDFVRGDFPVDGKIDPLDAELSQIGGMHFSELSDEWKRRFNQFTVRMFRIVDYRPEEPGELFFRLNQPTSLTSAEQRNAFFGPTRNDIKTLVNALEESGLEKSFLGFSNSRMAYDDVLARVSLTVLRGTIAERVTAADLVDLYRKEKPLPPDVVSTVHSAVKILGEAKPHTKGHVQLNKATVYTWFVFVIRAHRDLVTEISADDLGSFMAWFEDRKASSSLSFLDEDEDITLDQSLFRIYVDRSTSRVADVSSVVLRDAIIWLGYEKFLNARVFLGRRRNISHITKRLHTAMRSISSPIEDDAFARALIEHQWGTLE